MSERKPTTQLATPADHQAAAIASPDQRAMVATPLKDASFTLLCGGFNRCDASWSKPSTGVDQCYKLYFVVRGQGRLQLAEQEIALQEGHAYFIPGYHLSAQFCPHRMDVYWLHIIPDSLYLSFLLSHVPQVHSWKLSSLETWRPTYTSTPRLFEEHPLWLDYRVQALLLDLTSRVLEPYDFSHMAAIDPVFQQLQPAIAFMDERLLESPTLSQIARVVHLAPNYFHRKFTGTFHITPLGYMLRKRLNMAKQLLLGGKESLETVAAKTGFSSPFYLWRMFKQHYHISPSEFRSRSLP